jgi:hypothetical protein
MLAPGPSALASAEGISMGGALAASDGPATEAAVVGADVALLLLHAETARRIATARPAAARLGRVGTALSLDALASDSGILRR